MTNAKAASRKRTIWALFMGLAANARARTRPADSLDAWLSDDLAGGSARYTIPTKKARGRRRGVFSREVNAA
jgi:hypothetical protein